MNNRKKTVVGLDLSLTCPGVCIIPPNWIGRDGEPDMHKVMVSHKLIDYTPRDDHQRAERLLMIESWASDFYLPNRVFAIESLPSHGAFAIVQLAELHGVIRRWFRMGECDLRTAPQATARKLFMGELPKKDQKVMVQKTVQSLDGCSSWTGDECDAFVVANWLRAELGLSFLSAPVGILPKMPSLKIKRGNNG